MNGRDFLVLGLLLGLVYLGHSMGYEARVSEEQAAAREERLKDIERGQRRVGNKVDMLECRLEDMRAIGTKVQ